MERCYITGDIHSNPKRIIDFVVKYSLTKSDIIIILGDVGANYFCDIKDILFKEQINCIQPTVLCIHGNHEKRPESISSYHEKEWHNGIVFVEDKYPNLIFAKDGEIYDVLSKKCIAIGGAYSIDWQYRIINGFPWWADEQPSNEKKKNIFKKLSTQKVDIVFSHTCPEKYIQPEALRPGVNQDTVDRTTEKWLNKIEAKINYTAWYCGHWHINKRVDEMHFLFDYFEKL